jgi:hypothetical protein
MEPVWDDAHMGRLTHLREGSEKRRRPMLKACLTLAIAFWVVVALSVLHLALPHHRRSSTPTWLNWLLLAVWLLNAVAWSWRYPRERVRMRTRVEPSEQS